MINSYFRKRIEAQLAKVYVHLEDLTRADLLDPLKDHTALYKELVVDPDWIVTTGLCLNDNAVNEFVKGEITEWTLEVQCRHKTNPNHFVDILVQSGFSNTGFYTAETKPKADVTNMETHLDFELVKAFVVKLETAVKTMTFADGKVLFTKNEPEA